MDFIWHVLALIGISLPNILGFNLVFGKGKIFYFGPIGVSALTAYAIFLTLNTTGSFGIAMIVGLCIVTMTSMIFVWLSLTLEPDGLGVMSIAVHLAILAVILNWNALTRGALGVPRIPHISFLDSVSDFALFALLLSAVWIFILWKIDRSAFGRKINALAEHEWHARSLGVDRARVHCIAFIIAGVGAFLTSFMFPQFLVLLHPSDYQFSSFIFLIMVVVAGKPGSVFGVTLSTVLLIVLKESIRFLPLAPTILGPVRLIIFGCILFIGVWFRRDVIFPMQRQI